MHPNVDEQSSVRMLQQAAVVSCLLRDATLWSVCNKIIGEDQARSDQSTFTGSLSALLVIGLLYGIALKDGDFFTTYIGHCLRLQQSNNFLIRIHGIGCVKSAFDWISDHDGILNTVTETFPFLQRHVRFAQQQAAAGNMGRNVDRIMNNIYFKKFDFTKHLTFAGIFRYLPLHGGVQPAGLIPAKFLQETSNPKMTIFGEFDNEPEIEEVAEFDEFCFDNLEESPAVQQKISPWMNDQDQKLRTEGKLGIHGAFIRTGQKTFFCKSGRARIGRATLFWCFFRTGEN